LADGFETIDGIWCNGAQKDKVLLWLSSRMEIEIRFKVQILIILQYI
jgi:hypothetical protein